jgi:4-diphosphocytidyl-2-C-methyl-D-erythritol kinase
MIAFPPCKINLGLTILSKREDGFHDIETCFYPVPWTDILEIIPSPQTEFTSSGIPVPGNPEENLCVRAYHLLRTDFGIGPVKIHLHKILPMGAGLGGGSSNAAHTLLLLNTIFNLGLPVPRLQQYAAKLGSDCSFFVQDSPMMGSGRGEVLSEVRISLSGLQLVLVKPSIHVSTQQAYAGIVPQQPKVKIADIIRQPVNTWKGILKNDFEESIFKDHPLLRDIKEKLYSKGAIYASMSGSGSTIFGLFEKPFSLRKEFNGMEYWQGVLS